MRMSSSGTIKTMCYDWASWAVKGIDFHLPPIKSSDIWHAFCQHVSTSPPFLFSAKIFRSTSCFCAPTTSLSKYSLPNSFIYLVVGCVCTLCTVCAPSYDVWIKIEISWDATPWFFYPSVCRCGFVYLHACGVCEWVSAGGCVCTCYWIVRPCGCWRCVVVC